MKKNIKLDINSNGYDAYGNIIYDTAGWIHKDKLVNSKNPILEKTL